MKNINKNTFDFHRAKTITIFDSRYKLIKY